MDKKLAITKLWELGDLTYKLKGIQRDMRNAVYESKGKNTVFLCARRTGKCLVEGTKVLTLDGQKNIEDIQLGDLVYGYHNDGTITEVEVEQLHNQGLKEVVELKHRGKVVAECTFDHRWLVWDDYRKTERVVETRELLKNSRLKIRREYITTDNNGIHEPHAYALGALLGDGYGKFNKGTNNQISISSESADIPKKVAESLGCNFWKAGGHNFSWVLANYEEGQGRKKSLQVPINVAHYDDWCKNKMAHQKTCDYDVIRNWNRESKLNFIAGLIDTDGSIFTSDNRLFFSLGMQAKPVIDCVKELFLDLWQIELDYSVDNREKYVNGPCYIISKANNFCNKHFLKELSPFLACKRKQYKPEYDSLKEYNHKEKYCGVTKGETRIAQTYDIGIDTESHLFLLANGFITHNSFTMCTIAVEYCIRQPNQVVKLIFPKKKDARSVAKSHMVEILMDCPPHIKPEYKTQDNEYLFPNGSMIQMAGTDGGSAESVRGSAANLILLDEAGFHDYAEFTYIVRSILMPTLLTTKGKMIMASTPSKQPDHPFMIEYVSQARAEQTLIEYDIYKNPLITPEDIEEIIDEYPGREEDPAFKREFLLISEADTDAMVIPEFTPQVKYDIVKETMMPAYYDCYVSGDPAVGDLTGILFAYYDFLRDKLVILDELVMGGPGEKQLTTQDIADGIFRKERSLFRNPLTGEKNEPHKRIMDNNNPILINDLNREHGLRFIATRKDNKEEQINKVRMMIRKGDIEIHPRCKNLIYHIETARWKIRKSDGKRMGYERVSGTSDRKYKAHHADLVDALIYLVRNVNKNKNPFPEGYDFNGLGDYYSAQKSEKTKLSQLFDKIMNKK